MGRTRHVVVAALTLAVCSGPAIGFGGTPGFAETWELSEIDQPIDFEFLDGALYVVAGTESPELWKIEFGLRPVATQLPLDGLPAAPGRLLESSGSLLFLAGYWGSDVYSLFPDGVVGGAFRNVSRARDFIPWTEGDFLLSSPPGSPGRVIEASRRRRRGGEHLRGWGSLPDTEIRKVTRSEASPLGDVLIERDLDGRVHAVMNRDGILIQYRRDGEPTLVSWLPDDMVSVGRDVAIAGYGQPLRQMINGFELDCEGRLWATVGRRDQRVVVLDAESYEVERRWHFDVPMFDDAFYSSCGDWVVGLSKSSGRLIVGRIE